MTRWLADENFNNNILRALFRENRNIDVVRAQDVGLAGVDDEKVLAWAASQNRILLTHVSSKSALAFPCERQSRIFSS
jgi:predicted nuclease of predicted toxin-antitoxin system